MEKPELLSALFRGDPDEDFQLFAQKSASGRGPFQMDRLNCWVCLLFMLLASLPQSGASQRWDGIIVTQSDYEALRAIKQSFTDPNDVLRSWNDSGLSACSGGWAGIKCAKGQVIVLQLPWRGLGGRISEKIGQLASLRKLNLHDNFIGGLVPTSLGFLPKLRGLILFNNHLVGQIPPELGNCPLLQTVDLSNNTLEGIIPTGLFISTKLYRLNLSHNSLSGPVPVSLTHSVSVTFVDLSYNNISGLIPDTWGNQTGKDPYQLKSLFLDHNQLNNQIPESLDRLQNLSKLDLSENDLVGPIPSSLSKLPNLEFLNVSYNNLSGPVPFQLTEKFKTSSFRGNLLLCGYDVSVPCSSPPPSHNAPPQPPPPAKSHSHRLNNRDVILIVVGVLLVLVLVICCLLLLCLINRRTTAKKKGTPPHGAAAAQGEKVIQTDPEAGGEAGGKLVHFDGPLVFTADDLLCATAEIMGKSTYGTVYKATLEDGSEVAVKRLREKIAKGQKEFETEVNELGQIRHPNLLALRAYYVGPKGEKLLVFDYMPKGTLASFLHARGPDTPINWGTRLNIAIGVAQGINYLHIHLNMVHGNLTSANILLDEKNNSKVSDYGLSRLMTAGANSNVIATAGALGYRAPELSKGKKASTKSDVYSLGVILLELLTGKSPGEAMNGVDLPQWVASTMKEEWTNEVFDLELMRESAAGDELLNALKLALHCVDPTPSARPEVEQVLQQLMEMKQEVTEGSEQERAAEPSND